MYKRQEYRQALSALRKLEMTEAERERRGREYRRTADELAAANIRPGEEEQLLARRELLRNSEKLAIKTSAMAKEIISRKRMSIRFLAFSMAAL